MALNESKDKNDMQDIKYVEEAEESVATETDADRVAEEKALVRKIDIALLPCIWIMYLLSYMDVRHTYRVLCVYESTADTQAREPTSAMQRSRA
jgi:hypothetical protein